MKAQTKAAIKIIASFIVKRLLSMSGPQGWITSIILDKAITWLLNKLHSDEKDPVKKKQAQIEGYMILTGKETKNV